MSWVSADLREHCGHGVLVPEACHTGPQSSAHSALPATRLSLIPWEASPPTFTTGTAESLLAHMALGSVHPVGEVSSCA